MEMMMLQKIAILMAVMLVYTSGFGAEGFSAKSQMLQAKNATNASATIPSAFEKALNQTGHSLARALLFRYPELFNVASQLVNNSLSSSNDSTPVNITDICLSAKNLLNIKKDNCKPPFISGGIRRLCLRIANTTKQTNATSTQSSHDICSSLILAPTTPAPLKQVGRKRQLVVRDFSIKDVKSTNDTAPSMSGRGVTTIDGIVSENKNTTDVNTTTTPAKGTEIPYTHPHFSTTPMPIPIPLSRKRKLPDPFPMPTHRPIHFATNYFFLAIKVIAKTVIITYKERCRKSNGEYDSISNTCRIPITDNSGANQTNQNNVSTNYTVVQYEMPSSSKRPLFLLSMIGNVFSIVCLIGLLLSYSLMKTSLSTLDKSIMCLSFCMAFSHTLQLMLFWLGKKPGWCKIIGILLHWSLLTSFMWMALISYSFFVTFSRLLIATNRQKNRRFRHHFLFATSIPTSVTLVCFFLGISKEDFSGYGANGICFVSKFWANLFAFVVPVALILVMNVTFLTFTVFKIRKTKKDNDRALRSNNNKTKRKKIVIGLITLKLSILFGIGWLLGFLDGFIPSKILSYMFNVIVSTQGIAVFIAFGNIKHLFEKTVWKVVRRSRNSSRLTTISHSFTNPRYRTTSL
ncbi:adhesion G protein-coupled receptor E3-like [Rhopilema esculentum]|uniref:adhesion G protein-coupled receptor E3-like n=1 Tax=Rhopilema esculentum TaxID=499914 RepID=UPI0031D8E522